MNETLSRIGVGVVLTILILLSIPTHCVAITGIQEGHRELSEILDENSEIEYRIEAAFIREWNYTVEGDHIRTHNGTLFYEAKVDNEISITIDIVEIDERITLQVHYEANTPTGYYIDTSYIVELNPETGYCIIKNGPLEGFYGRLSLFFNYEYPDIGMSISSIAEKEIVVTGFGGKRGIEIMEEYQTAQRYNCSYNDTVDGEVTHDRYYEEDTSLLCRGFGAISDLILLGMANISYAHGFMYLEDTNIELGDPFWVPFDPGAYALPILGVVGIGIFVVFYILIYKAQRRQDHHS
ncbi:MAG: hypothetical protein R6V83_08030 [Candidatus Thorarchaeota archaeon]